MRLVGVVLSLSLLAGCSKSAPPPQLTPEVLAKNKWATHCAACHGEAGRGDGPSGKVLKPGPRDFADPGWQASVSDAHIRKVIVKGGLEAGLSNNMPGHQELAGEPAVVDALVQIVRSFGP